ncbi:dual specificity calcium/calmodulin-dependent 3',5'-cyclic nucleotide phosphodiesterase 1A-like isoform X3 [Apostichopus japonicus]|uniref:dual specificity calcium/calmodulin-dependent 3',5'-cyclic nucleotide phosphodiesterase 1A-like isoform X3 n=1 Tax=Stichopus japonicus TaxID=307972 RepID=UPI003AB8649E
MEDLFPKRSFGRAQSATISIDGCSYTIVANSSKIDRSSSPKGRREGKGWKDLKSSKRRLRRQTSQQIDEESLTSLDLSMKENMPSVSTTEGAAEAAMRLRSLVLRLDKETITTKDLKENLEYAVAVLDAIRKDESRFNNEEDELSEVATEEVPEQVRNWLTSTFSRQSTRTRLGDEKPRFRSIVQALRTGLFIDRMFRRTSASMVTSFPPRVASLFKYIDDWSFDIFAVNREAEGHALKCIVHEILNRYDLLIKFKIPFSVLSNFLDAMETGYSKHSNPYHNLLHAADVAQTVHHMLARMGLVHWISDLEIFACILAAVMHDFEHTGTTNNFHINTGSDMAYLYNDRAVLENHHVSSTFRLMREDDKNILANVSTEEFKELRNLIIEMVLATDMSYHFQQIKQMKGMIGNTESIEKVKALSMILHCADISHAAKEWKLHSKWTQLLMQEFFRQGDRERDLGIAISPLCDRNTTLIAESQIGFIDFIVEPSLHVCGDMIDQILEDELNSTSSTPEESIVSGKRNSIPLTRPSSAPRSSSVPAPTNHESESRPPSSPGRLSMGRSNTLPAKCSRCWTDKLSQNKGKWREIAATEVRGTLVFEHILEEPPDFNEVQEDHISVSQQASIDQGNKPEAHNSDKGTANGDMSNATKGKTERADKT